MIAESTVEGLKVRLRPLEERDLPCFVEWLADRELTRWLTQRRPYTQLGSGGESPTLDGEYEWHEQRRRDPDGMLWAIETVDRRLLGHLELRIAAHAHRAELGIAIQDKSQWGRGLGTEAVRLLLGQAFGEMGLNRVELHTHEENARAIRSYEKCGFKREGLWRQHNFSEGKFGNTVSMAILREEWARARRKR